MPPAQAPLCLWPPWVTRTGLALFRIFRNQKSGFSQNGGVSSGIRTGELSVLTFCPCRKFKTTAPVGSFRLIGIRLRTADILLEPLWFLQIVPRFCRVDVYLSSKTSVMNNSPELQKTKMMLWQNWKLESEVVNAWTKLNIEHFDYAWRKYDFVEMNTKRNMNGTHRATQNTKCMNKS